MQTHHKLEHVEAGLCEVLEDDPLRVIAEGQVPREPHGHTHETPHQDCNASDLFPGAAVPRRLLRAHEGLEVGRTYGQGKDHTAQGRQGAYGIP